MKCSNCGADVPQGGVFCANCGTKTEPPAEACRSCQAPLKPGAKFCDHCGAATVEKSAACPRCTAAVLPGAVFCPNCGHNLKAPAAAAAAVPAAPTTAFQPPAQTWQQPAAQPTYPAYAQPAYGQPSYGQPSYGQPAYGQPAYAPYGQAPQPVRKKKKGWVVGLVILLVVLLAGGGAFVFAGKDIMRMIKGPKATYVALEAKALKQDAADLVEDLVRYGNQKERGLVGGSRVDLKVTLDDALGIDPALAATLENISFSAQGLYDQSGASPRYFASVDLLTGNEKLLSLEAFLEQDSLVLGLPGILSQYIVAGQEELSDMLSMLNIDTYSLDSLSGLSSDMLALDLGINQAAMQKSLNQLIDIVLKHMDKAEFKKNQTLKVGSVSAQYDLYTITLSSENARKMLIELFKAIRDDKEIYQLASRISELSAQVDPYGYAPAELTLADYKDSLNEVIADLEDDEDFEEFTLIQKIYVDKQDEVAGREITVKDDAGKTMANIQLFNPVSGEKEALLVAFKGDDGSMTFTANYTNKNDLKTGDARLVVNDEEVLRLTFKNLIRTTIDGNEYILGEVTAQFDAGPDTPDTVTYKCWQDKELVWLELGVPEYGILQIGYQEVKPADVKIPPYDKNNLVSISDTEALQGLITEDVMQELMEIMEKLGLSDMMMVE